MFVSYGWSPVLIFTQTVFTPHAHFNKTVSIEACHSVRELMLTYHRKLVPTATKLSFILARICLKVPNNSYTSESISRAFCVKVRCSFSKLIHLRFRNCAQPISIIELLLNILFLQNRSIFSQIIGNTGCIYTFIYELFS